MYLHCTLGHMAGKKINVGGKFYDVDMKGNVEIEDEDAAQELIDAGSFKKAKNAPKAADKGDTSNSAVTPASALGLGGASQSTPGGARATGSSYGTPQPMSGEPVLPIAATPVPPEAADADAAGTKGAGRTSKAPGDKK